MDEITRWLPMFWGIEFIYRLLVEAAVDNDWHWSTYALLFVPIFVLGIAVTPILMALQIILWAAILVFSPFVAIGRVTARLV